MGKLAGFAVSLAGELTEAFGEQHRQMGFAICFESVRKHLEAACARSAFSRQFAASRTASRDFNPVHLRPDCAPCRKLLGLKNAKARGRDLYHNQNSRTEVKRGMFNPLPEGEDLA